MPTNKQTSESHPSYGMAGFSRTTGNRGMHLFGSSIRHNETIVLHIYRAERIRDLSYDRFHPGKELIEVTFSPTQFAELITTMNCGRGVPCTIDHVGGERMPQCPDQSRFDKFTEEFEEDISEVTDKLKKLSARSRELLSQSKMTKAEREELSGLIGRIESTISSSIPFVHQQFNEACAKTVTEAKGEIDASLTSMIHKFGMDELQERLIGKGGDATFPAIEHQSAE